MKIWASGFMNCLIQVPFGKQSCQVWFDQDKQAEGDPNSILMLAGRPGIARVFLISIEMQSTNGV